jgi:8-oxo-dGTP pyrophosphatase MutT (NUDIX family)
MTESPPIRDAATVVLLRDGAGGIETWLLVRARQLVFAGGMTVFPGGRVDDADEHLPFVDGTVAQIAERFECDTDYARRLAGAAVRETFEETGVLLTSPPADLRAARTDVEDGRLAFGALLREHGLAVDAGQLRPWSRWVTPPGETRRYDTRFFVAAQPAGAEAEDGTTESTRAMWLGPAEALAQAADGQIKLLPPTIMTLASLQPFGTVAEVLDAAMHRSLDAIRPNIRFDDESGDIIAELPDGASVRLPRSMFT